MKMRQMRLLRRDDDGVFPWTEQASKKPNMKEIPQDEADEIVARNMGLDCIPKDMVLLRKEQIEAEVRQVSEKEKEFLEELKELEQAGAAKIETQDLSDPEIEEKILRRKMRNADREKPVFDRDFDPNAYRDEKQGEPLKQ